MGDPLEKSRRGPSDHVPLGVTLSRSPLMAAGDQPIPAWVCKNPLFGLLLQDLETYVQVSKTTGVERWEARKAEIREAGRRCRNAMIAGVSETAQPPLALIIMCARAVWRQDFDSSKTTLLRTRRQTS